MVERPTGSDGEPSSPNCKASAGVKVRQPHSFSSYSLDSYLRRSISRVARATVSAVGPNPEGENGLYRETMARPLSRIIKLVGLLQTNQGLNLCAALVELCPITGVLALVILQ